MSDECLDAEPLDENDAILHKCRCPDCGAPVFSNRHTPYCPHCDAEKPGDECKQYVFKQDDVASAVRGYHSQLKAARCCEPVDHPVSDAEDTRCDKCRFISQAREMLRKWFADVVDKSGDSSV